jgi:5-methylcytosine-specific restriction protein A
MSPFAPRSPCTWPGCPALTDGGRCEQHRKQERQQLDDRRGTAASRGYNSRWSKARAAYLAEHPLCVVCRAQNRYTSATVVDHIRAHKGDMDLFWDVSNWQSLCKQCHDIKTANEGRWG